MQIRRLEKGIARGRVLKFLTCPSETKPHPYSSGMYMIDYL